MAHAVVTAMAHGPSGFLWLGTEHGIYRYDGYEVVRYADSGLRSAAITALHLDPQRRLWAGTREEGLFRFLPGAGGFVPVLLEPEGIPPPPAVTSIAGGADGRLRVGTPDGLLIHSPTDRSTTRIGHDPLASTTIAAPKVTALALGSDGSTLAGSSRGAITVIAPDGSGTRIVRLPAVENRDAGQIRSLLPIAEGTFVGADAGLFRLDPESGETARLLDAPVAALSRTPERVWVLTDSRQLFSLDPVSAVPRLEAVLPFHAAGLFADHSDALWFLTTDSPPRLLAPGALAFTQLDQLANQPLSSVLAVEPLADGSWLLGTRANGIFLLEPDSMTLASWYSPVDQFGRPAPVIALSAAPGRVLAAYGEAGTELLEPSPDGPPRSVWRSPAASRAVLSLPDSSLVGTERFGLVEVPLGGRPSASVPVPVPGAVRALATGGDGEVWVGTDRTDLFRFTPGAGTAVDQPNHPFDDVVGSEVIHIFSQPDGMLLLAARSAGLALFNPSDESAGWHVSLAELGNAVAHAAVAGADGTVWVSTSDGLFQVPPDGGAPRSVLAPAGLTTRFTPGALKLGADGVILAGTIEGLVAFAPQQVPEARYLPRPVVTSETIAGGITVVPGEDAFTVAVSALDFAHPGLATYSFRLQGEERWSLPSPERSIRYESVRPGSYELRIRATGSGGQTGPESSVMITVLPAIWQTGWFLALAGAAFLGVGLLCVIVLRRARARAAEAGGEPGDLRQSATPPGLQHSVDQAVVNMHDYLAALIPALRTRHRNRVQVATHVRAKPLEVSRATPCGLIASELVSRAMTLAFEEPLPRGAAIFIEFVDLVPEGARMLRVADNGGSAQADQGRMLETIGPFVTHLKGTLTVTTGGDSHFGTGSEIRVVF